MFQSIGYFRTVYCPTDCLRPYCIFRHKPKIKHSTSNSEIPLSIECINNEINKLQSDINSYTKENNLNSGNESLISNNIKYSHNKSSFETSEKDEDLSVDDLDSGSIVQGARGPTYYKPHKKNEKSKIIYSTSKVVCKNDMEYDPMSNYSAAEFLSKNDQKKQIDLKRPFSTSEDISIKPKKSKIEVQDKRISPAPECGLKILENEDEEKINHSDIKNIEENIGKNNNSIVKDIFGTDSDTEFISNVKTKQSYKDKINEVKTIPSKKKVDKRVVITTGIGTTEKKISSQRVNNKVKNVKTKKTCTSTESKKVKKNRNHKTREHEKEAMDINKYISKEEIDKLNKELSGQNIYNECLKLYNEYENDMKLKNAKKLKIKKSVEENKDIEVELEISEEDFTPKTKIRVAHSGANNNAISAQRPRLKRFKRSTPAQIMMSRFQAIQDEKTIRELDSVIQSTSSCSSKRVAHNVKSVPNTITKDAIKKYRVNALSQISVPKKSTAFSLPIKTVPKTNANVKQEKVRVAHAVSTSDSTSVSAPRIAIDRHSKVPTNIRQKCVLMFWKEYLRITRNDHEKARELTLAEEEQCKLKSNSKTVYKSVCANVLKNLRSRPEMTKKQKISSKTMSELIKNKSDNSTTIGIHSFALEDDAMIMYEKMCHYIMSIEEMEENHYPLSDILPGRAVIKNLDPLPKPSTTDRKICSRCGQEFVMNKSGKFKHDVQCIFHWGRAYNTKVGYHYEKRYSCCAESVGAPGCCIAEVHVHMDNKYDFTGYVKTFAKSPSTTTSPGVYALDCEMCYTSNGFELARVSVVDHNCKVVYDTFVKPSGLVLDYNTRWSGITEKNLKNCKITIRDVQAVFLSKFSADTIFIGHSLESDLVALRIIHTSVIDTSVVFPHKLGLPYKRALRNLMSEFLGIVIQTGASDGHDSHEDATACMKLMLWKLNEDSKIKGKL